MYAQNQPAVPRPGGCPDEHPQIAEHVGAEGEHGREVRMGGQKRTNAETIKK